MNYIPGRTITFDCNDKILMADAEEWQLTEYVRRNYMCETEYWHYCNYIRYSITFEKTAFIPELLWVYAFSTSTQYIKSCFDLKEELDYFTTKLIPYQKQKCYKKLFSKKVEQRCVIGTKETKKHLSIMMMEKNHKKIMGKDFYLRGLGFFVSPIEHDIKIRIDDIKYSPYVQ